MKKKAICRKFNYQVPIEARADPTTYDGPTYDFFPPASVYIFLKIYFSFDDAVHLISFRFFTCIRVRQIKWRWSTKFHMK